MPSPINLREKQKWGSCCVWLLGLSASAGSILVSHQFILWPRDVSKCQVCCVFQLPSDHLKLHLSQMKIKEIIMIAKRSIEPVVWSRQDSENVSSVRQLKICLRL